MVPRVRLQLLPSLQQRLAQLLQLLPQAGAQNILEAAAHAGRVQLNQEWGAQTSGAPRQADNTEAQQLPAGW